MPKPYLEAFKALLNEFVFALPEYNDHLAQARLFSCFHTHGKRLAEQRARALSGEHEVPYEIPEMAIDRAVGDHKQPIPMQCPKGYESPAEMKQCPFAWRLDYLALNEDEMLRLGQDRAEQQR